MAISKEKSKKLKLFFRSLNHESIETGKINFECKFFRRYKGCREYFYLSDNGMKLFVLKDNNIVELI